jgi:hypothetical protein
MNWSSLLNPVIGLLTPVVIAVLGGLIHKAIVTPKDHERAALLATIAQDSASFIVAMNPNKSWDDLLKDVVNRISAAAGLPTSNATAIQNAAAGALTALGKAPVGLTK